MVIPVVGNAHPHLLYWISWGTLPWSSPLISMIPKSKSRIIQLIKINRIYTQTNSIFMMTPHLHSLGPSSCLERALACLSRLKRLKLNRKYKRRQKTSSYNLHLEIQIHYITVNKHQPIKQEGRSRVTSSVRFKNMGWFHSLKLIPLWVAAKLASERLDLG